MLTRMLRGSVCAMMLMAATVGTVAAETAADLYEKISAKSKQVTSCTMKMTNKLEAEGMSMTSSGTTTYVRNDGKLKMRSEMKGSMKMGEMEMPSDSLTVSDGKTLWAQQSQFGQVMVTKMNAPTEEDQEAEIRNALKTGESKILSAKEVNGHMADGIEITMPNPMDPSASASATFWFTQEHGVMVRMEMKADKMSNVMDVTELKMNEKIDDTMFSYTPPEGAVVNEM